MSEQQSSAFFFTCPDCGGRWKVPPGQAGQKFRCPRCNAEVLAPASDDQAAVRDKSPPAAGAKPAKIVKPPKTPPEPADRADEDSVGLRLSAVVDRLPAVSVSPTDLRNLENATGATTTSEPTAPPKTVGRMDVVGEQARRVMAKAETEAQEVERAKPHLPQRPFVTGVISFLFDGDAAWRWLMLTLLLQALAALLVWIVELGSGPGMAQIGAVLMTVAAAFLVLLFVATFAASGLAILQDTASGRDKIENWPGIQITDWMMDVFYVVNASLAAALPGLLLGGTWMCVGGKVWSAVYGGAMSTIALFPVFLISMVTEGSPFSIASLAVWGTLRTAPRLWGKFYLLSAALGLGLLLLVGVMTGSGFFLRGLCSALAVAVIMINFGILVLLGFWF